MIEGQHLFKTYKDKTRKNFFSSKYRKQVINDVSLSLEEGKIVGVLGINGAGKTTLIKMLTSLLKPDQGRILCDGLDVEQNIRQFRSKINLITGGERNLYWRLSAKENLSYFGTLYEIDSKSLEVRIEYLLRKVDLWDKRDVPVEQFSKGMKQRLQIAKGLINNPTYIFLDEPTLGLDVDISRYLRTYIKQLAIKEKKAILLTTHYVLEAEELCDYVYILDRGQVKMSGTKEHIFQQMKLTKQVKIVMAGVNDYDNKQLMMHLKEQFDIHLRGGQMILHYSGDETELNDLLHSLISTGIDIISLETTNPTLEDVIIKMKKEEIVYEEPS